MNHKVNHENPQKNQHVPERTLEIPSAFPCFSNHFNRIWQDRGWRWMVLEQCHDQSLHPQEFLPKHKTRYSKQPPRTPTELSTRKSMVQLPSSLGLGPTLAALLHHIARQSPAARPEKQSTNSKVSRLRTVSVPSLLATHWWRGLPRPGLNHSRGR